MSSERSALLEIRDLDIDFGGLKAVDGLNMEVHEGEIVSVIGPNGAGKTTLFNAISAMVPITSGDIIFEGSSLLGLDANQVTARGIARTFQNVRLFINMTIAENCMVSQHCRTKQGAMGALFYTRAFRREEAEIRARAEQILGFFGTRLVGFRLDQPASTLSYANRRRLEIARAMATQPKLILLDEPVAGMNPVESAELTRPHRQAPRRMGVRHRLHRARHVGGGRDLRPRRGAQLRREAHRRRLRRRVGRSPRGRGLPGSGHGDSVSATS